MKIIIKYNYDFLKLILDRLTALILIFILSPLYLLVAFLILINLGNPIIFCHIRAGFCGKPFKLFKFRSMTNDFDFSGNLLPPEKRLTKFGIFLRSTSLDEIPSLINVLNGEMSFVGPRPLLQEYLPLYNEEQKLRHNVKPGITGLAQVNGRNSIPWEERFRLDVKYVRNRSLILDLKILFLTVLKVFARKGITPNNEKIMNAFTGKKSPNQM